MLAVDASGTARGRAGRGGPPDRGSASAAPEVRAGGRSALPPVAGPEAVRRYHRSLARRPCDATTSRISDAPRSRPWPHATPSSHLVRDPAVAPLGVAPPPSTPSGMLDTTLPVARLSGRPPPLAAQAKAEVDASSPQAVRARSAAGRASATGSTPLGLDAPAEWRTRPHPPRVGRTRPSDGDPRPPRVRGGRARTPGGRRRPTPPAASRSHRRSGGPTTGRCSCAAPRRTGCRST
jgi:hypothetical protein